MATVKSTLKGINRSSLTNNADLIECQELINLRFKEGKWQNVKKKTTQFNIGDGYEAMCVHNTSNSTNIVLYHEPSGKIVRLKKQDVYYDIFTIGTGKSVRFETVGNFLIVFDDTDKQMYYILWDIEINTYRYVGNILPSPIFINFHCSRKNYNEEFPSTIEDFAELVDLKPYLFIHEVPVGFIDNSWTIEEARDHVLATLDVAYNNWEAKGRINGYVVMRYAYELYDGTIIGHSNPAIMHIRGKVSDKYSPNMKMTTAKIGNRVFLGIDPGVIQYSIPSQNIEALSDLQNKYKGIIKSINIYMSKVYHKYTGFFEAYGTLYGRRTSPGVNTPNPIWEPTDLDSDEDLTVELILRDSQLYKIKTIPIDELGIISPTNLDTGDLRLIHTNDIMDTEEISDLKLYAKTSFVYNSRLWLGDIISHFQNLVNPNTYNPTSFMGGLNKTSWFEFILKTSQGNINVRSKAYINSDTHMNLPFCIYFNDSRASEFRILVQPEGDENIYICFYAKMASHPTFNYSYALMGEQPDLENSMPSTTTHTPGRRDSSIDNERISKLSVFAQVTWKYPTSFEGYEIASANFSTFIVDNNRVQISSVNNPMYFEAKNSYRVGNGTVKQFMSNAKPLTQLQFGQHPMFVFTSTGVFALEIGTGEVMVLRVSPITDEVITGVPTSYNGMVIFPTEKGIFALYGDSIKLISEAVHGDVLTNLVNNDVFTALNADLFANDNYISQVDFIQYINGSILAVDYINEELIVSNPSYNYCYILGLESKMWSKRSESFILFSNSWPTTYATIGRNGSVDLVELGKESGNLPVLIISRPSGFGTTDEKKIHHATLRTVISGNNGRVTVLLYGQLNEEGLIFLNNGKSAIKSSLVDLHLSKTSRSCRYTVLVFGCKPSQLLLDRLDCEVTTTWGG